MIEKLRIGIAPEIENQSYFDWTNRKIEEIRAGLTGCPSISVEVKDGWTWLVINTAPRPIDGDTFTRTIQEIERLGGAKAVATEALRMINRNLESKAVEEIENLGDIRRSSLAKLARAVDKSPDSYVMTQEEKNKLFSDLTSNMKINQIIRWIP